MPTNQIDSVPAAYDPSRDPKGRFTRGNTISRGHSTEVARRFQELKAAWYSATTTDDMLAVKAELKRLCLSADNEDVRLKAIVYFLDRMLGRPKEHVELDVTAGVVDMTPRPVPDLSPAEIEVLAKVVERGEIAG